MDKAERKAISDIEQYGCHIIHVFGEGELPPFTYSVGIWKSSHRPELIVVGLKQEIAHFVVNEYNRRVRAGEELRDGKVVSGFLEGFDCLLREVDRAYYIDYLGWDRWLYRGNEFPTFQLIWPTTTGIWPWQSEASDGFRKRQALLVPKPIH
jgi:hypothetical protein